jgi:hypothetical protein
MKLTFERIRHFVPNSSLFTAPPFPVDGAEGRRLCGTTNWAVEVYYVSHHPMCESPPAEFMAGKPYGR